MNIRKLESKLLLWVGVGVCGLTFLVVHSYGQPAFYSQIKFDRKPFQKSPHIIKQPPIHDRTSEYGDSYNPRPRVVEVDKNARKYEFRWTGFDGKEKVVKYQRPDAIEAIVSADAGKVPDAKFIYNYELRILRSSPTNFRNFIVQTFGTSPEVSDFDKDLFMFLQMGSHKQFREGVWWSWGYIGGIEKQIYGDNTLKFSLISNVPPGIVKCQVGGGEWGSMGADEEMPGELEDMMPVNDDLASSYTIGPDERLLKFSDAERISYLLENLPKFLDAGWMSEGTAKNYEQILKKSDLNEVFAIAKRDLDGEFIAGEVYQIIEGLTTTTESTLLQNGVDPNMAEFNGMSMTVAAIVTNAVETIFERPILQQEFESWMPNLNASKSQGSVAFLQEVKTFYKQLFFSQEYALRQRTDSEFVGDVFSSHLLRDPTTSELSYWTNYFINIGGNNDPEMLEIDPMTGVKGRTSLPVLNSSERRLLFINNFESLPPFVSVVGSVIDETYSEPTQ